MRKAAEMLDELNKMEFWVEDENFVSDSDPIEYVLECLLKGKQITVGVHKDFRNTVRVHKDFRNTSVSQNGFDASQYLK